MLRIRYIDTLLGLRRAYHGHFQLRSINFGWPESARRNMEHDSELSAFTILQWRSIPHRYAMIDISLQPCDLRHWELQVQFKIHGEGKDLFGDGLAIWYAKDKNHLGPVFGSKDYFQGLAIFIDTYSNHNGEHNVMLDDSEHACEVRSLLTWIAIL